MARCTRSAGGVRSARRGNRVAGGGLRFGRYPLRTGVLAAPLSRPLCAAEGWALLVVARDHQPSGLVRVRHAASFAAIVCVMKTAWIAGASVLVGSQLLALLLEDRNVRDGRLARPEAARTHEPQTRSGHGRLRVSPRAGPSSAGCRLLRARDDDRKAGSEQAFRAVDHDAVLAFAKAALAAGASGFVLVSGLGANARSRIFYNRVKGETEADLRALGFASLAIAQPSLLLG